MKNPHLKLVYLLFGLACAVSLMGGIWFQQSKQADAKFLNGETFKWQDYEGKWLVVNYFAQWCAPCLREIPQLNVFHQQQKNHNSFLLGVSFDSMSSSQLTQIKQQYDIGFPLLDPEYSNDMINPSPKHLPATYIISPQGRLVDVLLGEQSQQSIEKRLVELNRNL